MQRNKKEPVSRYKGRILCLTSNFPRWEKDSTTPFVLNLASDLQEMGWKVDVLAPHAPGAAMEECLSGVYTKRFKYLWPNKAQTVCYQGGALVNLRKDKSNYLKLPFLVTAQWLQTFLALNKNRYDILHSHWILPQGFTGIIPARIYNTPHVLTVHGGDIFGLQGKYLQMIKKKTLESVSAVTVNSSVTQKAVKTLSPSLKNIYRVPMGIRIQKHVDTNKAQEIEKKFRKPKAPLLIFAGRIVAEKGIEDIIDAVIILKRECPEIQAVMLGEGQDRPFFEALVQQMNLQDNIHFIGWVEPDLVHTFLTVADIFIGPSRTADNGWKEAQGLTFLEAMAAKTPVIATKCGGITDSVIHEQTGLLVDERAPSQIADAVLELSRSPQLVRKLKRNGYQKTANFFSREVSAQNFSSIFDRSIDSNKKNAPIHR